TLQELFKKKGYTYILGPKPVIKQSFQDGYISDGKNWMRMHVSRNLTSHTYDEETAEEIIKDIKYLYFSLFKKLKTKLDKEKAGK
ncbi:MAG: nucleotidyltransferase, partial [Bacteroidetes bacterium]